MTVEIRDFRGAPYRSRGPTVLGFSPSRPPIRSLSSPNTLTPKAATAASAGRRKPESRHHRRGPTSRTVLVLAANAEEYWTTQEIADFVGRSRWHVYRILAKLKNRPAQPGLRPQVTSSGIGAE